MNKIMWQHVYERKGDGIRWQFIDSVIVFLSLPLYATKVGVFRLRMTIQSSYDIPPDLQAAGGCSGL